MAKFDELEETHAELKLKELLWNAIDEWDTLLDDWTSVCFARIIFMVFINFSCQIDEWDTLLDERTSVCFARIIFFVLYLFIFLVKLMNGPRYILLELYSWYLFIFLVKLMNGTPSLMNGP